MSQALEIITDKNIYLLELFLQQLGSSKQYFRYFEKRNLSVINNHLVTYVLMNDNQPVCYGHLDTESGIVWLGIAVVEKETGLGWGNQMMFHLIEKAKELYIDEIKLSVDKTNATAIRLYEKFGFKKIEENQNLQFYKLLLR